MYKKKVLLVEDDPDHAELIIDELEIKDIKNEVILLRDGLEAMKYLQKIVVDAYYGKRSQIDLAIIDLNLPKFHGMSVLKFIKQHSKFYSIPVIILSTSSDFKVISEAYENGANSFVTKSIDYEEFSKKMKYLSRFWLSTNAFAHAGDRDNVAVKECIESLKDTVKNTERVTGLTNELKNETENQTKELERKN